MPRLDMTAELMQQRTPRHPFLHWLLGFGALGLFAVAVVDSSVIPIPGGADIFLVLLTINQGNWFLLASVTWLGSMLGGYLTYRLGVKGGRAILQRYVPAHRLEGVERLLQRHSFLGILVPALLPPPVPLVPFVLAAGTIGVARGRFLFAYGVARAIRYSLIGWLGALYGRHLLRKWGQFSRDWSGPIVWATVAFAVIATAITIWQYRVQSRKAREANSAAQPVA
jgi:membrane protein YqaA with SNARE-associated domain